MPAAIPVLIGFAQTAVGKLLIGAAINLAIGAIQAKLNRPKGVKPRDLQTTIRSGAADRYQHFGRVRVGGSLMFADYTTIGNTRRAFVLLAISTGGIDGVERFYLDGKPVNVNAQGYVTTPPWHNGKVRLRVRTGRPPEFAGGFWVDLYNAFPTRWRQGEHKLDGVATILGEFDAVEPDEVNDTYPGGQPPTITATIRGVPCYELTTGNYSFSSFPPRQLFHYLSTAGIGKIPISEFDIKTFTDALADCNDLMPALGGTRARYRSGTSFALNEPVKDVAGRLLEAMGGHLYLTQEGRIGLRVAKWRPPTYTIDDSKIVSIETQPGKAKLDRVTTLVPEYVEPALDYTETTADPWADPLALSRFGEPKPREYSVLAVQHHGQARALTKIAIARENPRVTATVSLRFWGLLLIDQERVYLHRPDRGIVNMAMRIVGLSLDLNASDGVVKVELESDEPNAYTWTAIEEGARPAAPAMPVNGRPPIAAPIITDVAVQTDGGTPPAFISGIVEHQSGHVRQVQFRPSGGNWLPFSVNQQTGYFRTPELADTQTYDIRARRVLSGLTAASLGNADSGDITKSSPWTTVSGIVVIANGTPPAAPVLVAGSRSGSTISITFRPDLGANYFQTGIWRGATFETATHVQWVRDQASTVTTTITDAPAPAMYWMRSGNGSGITSAPVQIGTL